ncbi:AsmA family protein [Photobacterium sp. SDRW27]|uniref:AsmA family protein n=1 Tax=Photobacterium obscurum TaxID=2829490 RepID=UPI002242FD41|nr:AsmA family protein [Photobacterium obscurum]MCW8330969.1 AsmA family protein [Photobacterium obscurum]
MSQEKTSTDSKSAIPRRRFTLKKVTKWVGVALLSPVVVATAALGYGIQLDLTPHREQINQWLSDNLHRDATINGDMKLLLSFSPEVRLSGVNIANIDAFSWQPMLTSGLLNAKISILPLLNGTLEIDYLALEDISLNLGKSYDGERNWIFALPQIPTQAGASPNPSLQADASGFKLHLKDHISAKNISLVYSDQSQGQFFDWYLETLELSSFSIDEEATANAAQSPESGADWQLTAKGSTMGQEYNLELFGELESLINHQRGNVQAKGVFAGAELNIAADIVPPHQGQSEADVVLHWEDTQPIEDLLGLDVKHIAPLSVTSHVSASANHIAVQDLTIDSPITQGSGYLDIRLDDHNTINGELTIPLIDLRPWLQPEPPQPMMMRAYSAAPAQSPLQRALDQWLMKTTTRLDLAIHEIKGLGTPVENLSLAVEGKEGKLSAPMTADIAEVPFRGMATIDATGWSSSVDISLAAKDSPLGEMARWLTGMPYAKGYLTAAELKVTTQGTKLSQWLENSEIALSIDDANVKWGSEASFSIDQARLKAGINQPFSSDIRGQLMGINTTITANAGSLGDIINGNDWPTRFHLSSPVLEINAEGLLKQTRWQEGSWFNLTASSNDAGKLSPWLGTQANISGAINIDGKLSYQDGWIDLVMPKLSLMHSQGDVSMRWRPDQHRPFLILDGHFQQLDFTQFGQFVNDQELPQVEQTVPTQGVNLDVPLLSNEIVIADADISLKVDKLKWAKQQMESMAFKGQIRNGQMPASPFSASYAGSRYLGDLAFNIDAATIGAKLNLAVNDPDIGAILSQFDISDELDMRLKRAQIAVTLSGRTVLELMEHTEVDARLFGGAVSIADTYKGKALDVYLDNGYFVTGPDTATRLELAGKAGGQAATIKLNSISLKEANDGRDTMPVNLAVTLGDMRFNASSNVALPVNPQQLNVEFDAFTPSLTRFNAFTGVELPPYGPVTLAAKLSLNDLGYHLRDMLVQVNDSKLTGSGTVLPPLKPNARPEIDLALHAPFIQLNDFKVNDWKAWAADSNTAISGENSKIGEDTTKDYPPKNKAVPVISPEGLEFANARFKLDVDEVRSGNDWLGAGQLHWQLENGVFELQPMHIQLPGGDINLTSQIKSQGEMFDIGLQGNINNFDYGILARRVAPETGMHGRISTQFNLTSLANSPDSLMNNANGFIGFAAWPQAFEADLIDLWAVSLTDAIIPNFTNNDPSLLNCVAAGLDINQGTMKQRDLLLDTTRIQVNGQFDASYADRAFSLYLRPHSKKAQIFSLQTPVEIFGQFEDFDFSVPLSAILETSVRFTTSPVVSPLRWLVEKPLAKDGSRQCEMIWQGNS